MGDNPKSFPKRTKCYIISCTQKWWAQNEGELSWSLASESSVICFSQWPVGRHNARDSGWGQCHPPDKHHREQISFRPCSSDRNWVLATWLFCLNPQSSLLLFPFSSHMLNCPKLRVLIFRFLKGGALGSWPNWQFSLRSAMRSQNATGSTCEHRPQQMKSEWLGQNTLLLPRVWDYLLLRGEG